MIRLRDEIRHRRCWSWWRDQYPRTGQKAIQRDSAILMERPQRRTSPRGAES